VEARSDGLIRESAELRRLIEIVEQEQELLRAGVERLTKQRDRSETAAEEAQALMSARFDQITDRASSLEVGVGSLTEAVQGAQAAAEAASVAVAQIRLTLDAPSPTTAPATGARPVIAVPPPMAILTPGLLGTALFKAAPAGNDGQPRLLVIDAAVRARELPLLMGPLAREFAEAWIGIAGGPDPIVLLTDPTLLSLEELTPSGSRGGRAPLARAFARAAATPDRPVPGTTSL
jgi:hypothetical protein